MINIRACRKMPVLALGVPDYSHTIISPTSHMSVPSYSHDEGPSIVYFAVHQAGVNGY